MAVFYSIDRGERLTFGIMYDVMAHPPKWFLEVAQHGSLGVLAFVGTRAVTWLFRQLKTVNTDWRDT